MTGPEHYQRAEDLLAEAERQGAGTVEFHDCAGSAQVHATLALTAATVDMAFAAEASPAARDWADAIYPPPHAPAEPSEPADEETDGSST